MNILYLEDNPGDADLTLLELRRNAPELRLELVGTIAAAELKLDLMEASIARGDSPGYDLALLDINLPDGSGLSVLSSIRHRALPLAVVVLTGSGDEDSVVSALRAGADDYQTKRNNYWAELPATLKAARKHFTSETARQTRPFRVLYAGASEEDAKLTRSYLSQRAPYIHFETVPSWTRAVERLTRIPRSGTASSSGSGILAAGIDVLLLEHRLPNMNALDILKEIRQVFKWDIPVLVVSNYGIEEIVIQAIKLGAADYIVKLFDYLHRLPPAIENAHFRSQIDRERLALRSSEERYRMLIEHSHDAIWAVDAEGRLTFMSQSSRNIFGRVPSEMVGQLYIDFMPPDQAAKSIELLQHALKTGEAPSEIECRVYRKNGTIVELATNVEVMRDAEGKVSGLNGTSKDITERKQEAEALHALAARSDEVREEERIRIAREIHDVLGQNLTALKMDSEWLRKKITGISCCDEQIAPLLTRIDGFAGLVTSTLAVVRRICVELRPSELDNIGLGAAIESHASAFQDRTGIKCQLQLEHERLAVDNHRMGILFRVYQELLTNVARHSGATEISITLRQLEHEIVLNVADNGGGFDASTKPGRKTLGILGIKERALACGGDVSFESTLGKGSVVTFKIPKKEPAK